MSENKPLRTKAGAGSIVLCLSLALILGAGVLAGLYFLGRSQEQPAARREASGAFETEVSLYVPEEPTGPVQTAEEVPDKTVPPPEEAYGYDYREILYDEDGLLVATIQGKRYLGYIAVIDDPSRVYLGTCGGFSDEGAGKRVDEIADAAGAILAVNGGGFSDPGGVGRGGMPTGIVIENGVLRSGSRCHAVGVDENGVLHAGYYSGQEFMDMGMRWAVSYGPTLLINGEIQEFNNTLEEPRTAVGQRADGAIVLLSIQGRQVSALGVTLRELSEILLDYGVIEASNLDGGASSNIYFNGEYINIANGSGYVRPMPTAVLVAPAGERKEAVQ